MKKIYLLLMTTALMLLSTMFVMNNTAFEAHEANAPSFKIKIDKFRPRGYDKI